ncbi:MAG: septum formation initiator family protein [Parabacteroides sp.]|nr:septum formation initiator family protein [Parabacteroides sp.]
MSRIKDFYNTYLSKVSPYWLLTIVFLIFTFTMGESSLYKRYTYDEKIRSLEKEIEYYQKEIEVNSKKLNDLHTDRDGLERFAREEYFMKSPNEDIFIIKED